MPSCCVHGCKSNTKEERAVKGIQLFSFPKLRSRSNKKINDQLFKRRIAWFKKANQKNIHNFVDPRICSLHFHGGMYFKINIFPSIY